MSKTIDLINPSYTVTYSVVNGIIHIENVSKYDGTTVWITSEEKQQLIKLIEHANMV